MRVLHLSRDDLRPGASRAAYRLHRNLQSIGVESQMLVQVKQSDDKTVFGASSSAEKIIAESRKLLDKVPFIRYPDRDRTQYSLQWLPSKIVSRVNQINPDLVNIHWVCDGYLPIESLARLNRPIVWTLRDMWPFTGGCHYSDDCTRYIDSCGSCPQLKSNSQSDLSHWVWKRKAKSWKGVDLTIVALSNWIGDCAASSSLFRDARIEVIPNGLNIQAYKPCDRSVARTLLNLPHAKKLVLFGAVNPTSNSRKGFHLLHSALQELKHAFSQDELELVVFGASQPDNPPDFGFKVHYLGQLGDDLSLSLVYSAADVLVAPSMQENLANTVLEAIACGTPCVAFNIGGMPDLIEHQKNGYLAAPYSIPDLAKGIYWVLEDDEKHQKLSYRAREKTEQEFTAEIQAHRYLKIFTEILTQGHKRKL